MRTDFYRDYFEVEDRHWWFQGRRTIFLALLDRYLPLDGSGDRAVLDVGCGTGTMLAHLRRYGSPTGIDAEEEALRLGRARGVDDVQLAEPPPLPFEDGSFDLETALDVLEHVDDDRELLREMYRTLRPGGLALLSVPAYRFLWGLQDEVSHHKRRYIAAELEGRIREAGFELVRLSYFNTILFAPIALVRLLRRVRPPTGLQSDFDVTNPGRLNGALSRVFASESRLLARRDLPFGVSILALARRGSGAPTLNTHGCADDGRSLA